MGFLLVTLPQNSGSSKTRLAFSNVAGHHQIFAAFSLGVDFDQRDRWSEERISAGADLSLASTGLKLEWLERVCTEASVANICPEDY